MLLYNIGSIKLVITGIYSSSVPRVIHDKTKLSCLEWECDVYYATGNSVELPNTNFNGLKSI